MTEYIELKVRLGNKMRKIDMQRASENKKSNHLCPKNNIMNTGTEKTSVLTMAAVMVDCSAFLFFSARCFVISRDTVMGMPEEAAVISTAKMERASW